MELLVVSALAEIRLYTALAPADCVELAAEAGVTAVIQPGGSINDQKSIDACNALGLAMYTTGVRHFRH